MRQPDPVSVAVLDDYQRVASRFADWDISAAAPTSEGRALRLAVTAFPDHLADQDALVARLHPFAVVVAMRERTPFPRAVLERLPDLRLLVTTGMRNASIDLAAAHELGIVVCGTRSSGAATPELTWALLLALTRGVAVHDAAVRAGNWQVPTGPLGIGPELAGRTLGIVGLGRIGARVARYATAFDMDVLAWSPHLTPERAAEHGARAVGKDELFDAASIVTVHVPLNDASRGLVGAADLRRLGPAGYLVNTSRGPVVEEAALIEALRNGWIAGAALDVFDTEPLPAHSPFHTTPNTLLSPHLGYVSQEAYRVFYADAVEDIAAWLAGSAVRVLS